MGMLKVGPRGAHRATLRAARPGTHNWAADWELGRGTRRWATELGAGPQNQEVGHGTGSWAVEPGAGPQNQDLGCRTRSWAAEPGRT